ncbi:MAG: hypothetical protein K2Z81_03625 [Cyanobacteria bacterium]|nr:hypothetical protein [Cyanobacteriota bacterium]
MSISLGNYHSLGIDQHSLIPLSADNNAFWVKLTSKQGSVEGKLHLPVVKTGRLVIFEPGFPGGSSTDFETHRLKGFLAAGYAVLTIRHNGSFLNGLHSDYYISCPPRQKRALEEGQEFLGDRGSYTLGNWLMEPIIAVESLGPGFDEIILMGHSFGGMALCWSLRDLCVRRSVQLRKIKRVISLAGATGRLRSDDDPILSQWEDYLESEWAEERVAIGETSGNIVDLRNAYRAIHDWCNNVIPEGIQFIFVCPWGDTTDSTDEFITPQESLDIILTLGRGTLIIDKTQRGDSETGALAHDLARLTTEMYLQLADPQWVPGKQILCLSNKGLH